MLFNSKTHAIEAGEYALMGAAVLVVAGAVVSPLGAAIAAKIVAITSAIGK